MRNSNGLAGFGFRSWTGGSASSCASWDSAVSTYVHRASSFPRNSWKRFLGTHPSTRSEEHTSELQSHSDLVCRLLLEKKKMRTHRHVNDQDTIIMHTA